MERDYSAKELVELATEESEEKTDNVDSYAQEQSSERYDTISRESRDTY